VSDFGVTQPLFLSSTGEPMPAGAEPTGDGAAVPDAPMEADAARMEGGLAAPADAAGETAAASAGAEPLAATPDRELERGAAGFEDEPSRRAGTEAAAAEETAAPQGSVEPSAEAGALEAGAEPRRESQPGAEASEPPSYAPPAFSMSPDDDEPHWRSVFADFLRLRSETGEPADSLSYERFRARLERNREQLKDKHRARTVRFQPYLKDGKVALRATPVK
jgi:hypothetical protein